MDLTQFHSYFDQFTERFMVGSERDRSLIQLKIDHTRRVFNHAQTITEEVLTSDDAGCALLAALFHDIGRFPQYQQYKTFNDRRSVDHGRLGVAVLKEERFLGNLPNNQQNLIMAAVTLHNKKALPENIPARLTTICKIVRDADKLDIFKVMLDHFSQEPDTDQTITLELTPHPTNYSRELYKKVMNRQNCLYTDMHWANDFKLMLAGWIYQLNFPITYTILKNSGDFDRLFEVLPKNSDFSHLQEILDSVMEERSEQRELISCNP